jgi:hypothetical protein
MTRTAEIRNRLTDDPQIELWIMDLLSRLPLEDAQPETPAFRFAETVKIARSRTRYAASEPWFDRTTPTHAPEPEPRQALPIEIHYPTATSMPGRRGTSRKIVNCVLACWWRLTGRGTAQVAWSIE